MIKLKNITKVFRDIKALDNISLEVKKNELIILKGPSGSGKSTLLSIIAALQKPTSGEAIVLNERISKISDNFASLFRRKHIGFIFQKFNLIPYMSVYENIITPLIPQNLSKKELIKKANKVMQNFYIFHKKDEVIKNLSGGEQQRVAIARALVNNPEIVLADEPTSNLDEKLSKEFIKYLKRIKEEQKTIIVATHDPIFFDLDIVDRIISIKNGKINEINNS